MRKLIIIAIVALSSAFSANAWIYVTSCGIAVQAVPPDAFDDEKERDGFYQDLENIYCKKDVKPTTPNV